jgi:hypothetical protein
MCAELHSDKTAHVAYLLRRFWCSWKWSLYSRPYRGICNLLPVMSIYPSNLPSPSERIGHRSSRRRSSPAALPPSFLLVYVTRIHTTSSCLYSPRSIQRLAESRLLDRTVIIPRETYIDQAEVVIQHFWVSQTTSSPVFVHTSLEYRLCLANLAM